MFYDPRILAYLQALEALKGTEHSKLQEDLIKIAHVQKVAERQAERLVKALRNRPYLAALLKEALKEI